MAANDVTASYEGGAGGKMRRRPLRRAATPYDRPPLALRNPRADGSGWLSKLVDPASKIISSSATRLFSSVFRKRLVGPPSASETNLDHRNEVPKDACITPSIAQEQGSKREDNPSNDNGINELEQLLKQKTFTRVEFDRLSELLRSRTVDSGTVDLFAGDENKRTEPSTSQAPTTYVGQEKATISPQKATISPQINGAGRLGLFGSTSTAGIKTSAVVEEAGSPAELAKAYMGTRLSKVSPPLYLQSRTSREDATLLHIVPSPAYSSITPSATRSSGRLPGLSDNGHLTQTPRGRSALYSMARSPYFRGFEPTDDRYAGPSMSSQWPRTNKMLPTSKQVLKRRSSVLDDDFGSVGPIRRIRQKSSMTSPFKDQSMNSIPRLHLVSASIHGSTSRQKANLLSEPKQITASSEGAEDGVDKVSNGSSIAVPPQSSEMARKILQQLDKIVPSPKEKSSELKLAMAREKSPSKLTLDMLNGRALKSMRDVESPKLQHVQDNGSLNGMSSTQLLKPDNLASEKQDKVGEKGSMKSSELRVMSAFEAGGMDNAVMSLEHIPSVVKPVDSIASGPTAAFQQNKRAFQMSAPEDSLEIDDDDDAYSRKSTFNPPAAEKEKLNSAVSDCKTSASETVIVEKAPAAPESEPSTNFMLKKGADLTARVPDGPSFSEKAFGFSFPTAPAPSIPNPPHPPSASQSPSLPNPIVLAKEQTGSVAVSFGSKSSKKGPTNFTFSSAVNKVSDVFSLNSGPGSDSKPDLLNSNASTSMTSQATSEAVPSDKGEKTQEASKLKRPLENVGSSVSTSFVPNIFSFGASTNSSQSNGFPTSSAISVSANLTNVASSSSSMDQVFSSSSVAASGSSLTSISATASTSAPSIFEFGSAPSTDAAASSSVAAPPVSSGLELTESKTSSLFNTTGSSLLAASFPSFTSTTSNIFGFSSAASSTSTSSAANQSQSSTPFGATSGSIFGTQMAPASSSFPAFTQTTPSQFGSSTSASLFGSSGSSSFSSSGSSSFAPSSSFGSATDGAKLFGSGSGFGLSSAPSFLTGGSSFSSSSSSFASSGTTTLFGSSSQPATSSIFGTGFGSTSPATGFSFGASTTAGTMPLTFGSSLGASSGSSMFPFTSAAAAPSALSPVRPVFGMSNSVGFGSASPGNDQMNVEDSMAEDTVQATAVPAFGQPASTPASSNNFFGSALPSGGSSVFQFGMHQNPAPQQNPSPFSATGNLDLPTGGSFSLGTGGDKSSRKIVRVRRDRLRKK